MVQVRNISYLLFLLLLQNFIFKFVCPQTKTAKDGFIILAVNCTSLDIEFSNFTKCLVRKNMENKNVVDLNIKVRPGLYENISVSASIYRKYKTTTRPFLYSDTFNFCEMLINPKTNIFWNILYRVLARYSNLNHSCPYEGDVYVKGLNYENPAFKITPLPRGEYSIHLIIGIKKAKKLKMVFYLLKA